LATSKHGTPLRRQQAVVSSRGRPHRANSRPSCRWRSVLRSFSVSRPDEGLASLREHGPQLQSDEEFEAFMDEAEAEALRQ